MNLLKYHSLAIIIDDEKEIYKVDQIIDMLKSKGYEVVCINKNNYNIVNAQTYESLKDVPHNIDVVIITNLSLQTYEILDEIELLDIKNIWFENGSYNESMLKKAKDLKLNISCGLSLFKEIARD
ncbi:CoA-binding protein [Faecalimicrobium sp. JNUCC 81]